MVKSHEESCLKLQGVDKYLTRIRRSFSFLTDSEGNDGFADNAGKYIAMWWCRLLTDKLK